MCYLKIHVYGYASLRHMSIFLRPAKALFKHQKLHVQTLFSTPVPVFVSISNKSQTWIVVYTCLNMSLVTWSLESLRSLLTLVG